MYLLDTNVVSATAPGRTAGRFSAWLLAHTHLVFLSVVTLAEVESGIAKARRQRANRKARDIEAWLDGVVSLYGRHILSFDIAVARTAGELLDLARSIGLQVGFADIAIAATAKRNDLVLLTRNLKHFRPLGVRAFDPLTDLPPG